MIMLQHDFFLVVFIVSLDRDKAYSLGCGNEGRRGVIGIPIKGWRVQARTSATKCGNSGRLGAFPIAKGNIEMAGM
jgi:hypothetical protein